MNSSAIVHHALLLPLSSGSAANAIPQADAAFTPPEWVHLIPAGSFSGRDGRGPYRLDADAVQAAFAKGGIDLPFDYDHQSISADAKQGPVPAAGWIKELQAREDGVWGRVEWTPVAAELLANREYRFVSPVFRHAKDGRVLALLGAGLTHTPNLDLNPAVNSQGDLMEDLMERLIAVLNLPAITTADELVAHLQLVASRLSEAETAANARATHPHPNLPPEGEGANAESHAQYLPDPAAWVPIEQHQAVASELAALQKQLAKDAAQSAVTAAMSAGKLAPAMQIWATAYAEKDPAGFAEWVESAPVIVAQSASKPFGRSPSSSTTLTGTGVEGQPALSDEERTACALLGMSEADFVAHKSKTL